MLLYVQTPVGASDKNFLRSQLPNDIEVVFESELPEELKEEKALEAQLVFGNITPEWVKISQSLLWMQLHSVGFDKYQDIKTSALITNMKGFYAQPCAETAIAGILALYRKMDWFGILRARHEWIGQPLRLELNLLWHKKVLLLGTGSIAQACHKILTGFDCDTQFFGRTSPNASYRTSEELLQHIGQYDIIINCLPGTDETKQFFSAAMIAVMKTDAVFANVGRGTTVDEPALISALLNGSIGGAALDVTDQEPLPADHPLWDCPNVVLSQHTGGGFRNEFRGLTEAFLRNLTLFLKKEPLENVVDLYKGY
ncbi:MAG: D-2-hydroxyacid dehydrogenase [Siphonobacter sp.]